MPRFRTIGSRVWIPADGGQDGSWVYSQIDIPLTAAEERERDGEEAADRADRLLVERSERGPSGT